MSEHAFRYEHTDIPAEMTVQDWRRVRAAARHRPRRLSARLRGAFRAHS